jgi:hypothetical protein
MRHKKRDFILLIVFQMMAFLVSSVAGERGAIAVPNGVLFILMLTVLLPAQYLMFRVTINFISKKSFKILYGSLMIVQMVFNGMTNREIHYTEIVVTATIGYVLSIVCFLIIFYVIIEDMFANKHDATYSLLAGTCAYLQIPVIFGYAFAIISLQAPSLLGPDINTGQSIIQIAFEASHYVAAGFDLPDSVGQLIKKIAVLESFLVNLYIIFIVGRLMANQASHQNS